MIYKTDELVKKEAAIDKDDPIQFVGYAYVETEKDQFRASTLNDAMQLWRKHENERANVGKVERVGSVG